MFATFEGLNFIFQNALGFYSVDCFSPTTLPLYTALFRIGVIVK